ncbi:desiccation-related protein PCC13-62 [Artemisia annua]|uniref:Desiccation-related protein PCC13-62 n=1 Tax=Artemisia annua TaxID=35608 RepID=A0A2U1M4I3_ARTAN|nr:desiccation-related protein PCC13-62 [Artemisia annua]
MVVIVVVTSVRMVNRAMEVVVKRRCYALEKNKRGEFGSSGSGFFQSLNQSHGAVFHRSILRRATFSAPEDDIDPDARKNIPKSDKDIFEFALNLEYLEAEFFLYGSLGKGLDYIQPNLTGGGPRPIGARIAKLTPFIRNVITQFGFQEVGHIRAIKNIVPGFARPLLNLSPLTFATTMNKAFGRPLFPPFNPYANDLNYLLASYIIPYVGLTGYVGANQKLQSSSSKLVFFLFFLFFCYLRLCDYIRYSAKTAHSKFVFSF